MEQLRKLQMTELELAEEFVRVCDLLGLEYFITCGTLLGAVRHGGFIPWDDDMDLGMMRADYDRFVKEAPALLGEKFYLDCEQTDAEFNSTYIKLKNKNTVFKTPYESDKICNGIFIDIFPFDLLPDDEKAGSGVIKRAQLLRWLHILRNTKKRPVAPGRSLKWRIQEAALRVVHPLLCVFPKDFFRRKLDKYVRQWNDKNTAWVTCHFDPEPVMMKVKDLYPLRKIDFEGKSYFTLNGIEEYLTKMYGDYMQLPPENKRITHMPEIVKFED